MAFLVAMLKKIVWAFVMAMQPKMMAAAALHVTVIVQAFVMAMQPKMMAAAASHVTVIV